MGELVWHRALAYPVLFLGVMYLAVGLLLAWGLVPPNNLLGLAAAGAFDSPEAWFSVHRTLGLDLMAAGPALGVAGYLALREQDGTALLLAPVSALGLTLGLFWHADHLLRLF